MTPEQAARLITSGRLRLFVDARSVSRRDE